MCLANEIFLEEFPENAMNLSRGSVLKSNSDYTLTKYGLWTGQKLCLGFDGDVIRSGLIAWNDIQDLIEEINNGHWIVDEKNELNGRIIDLSDDGEALFFALIVEFRMRPDKWKVIREPAKRFFSHDKTAFRKISGILDVVLE